MTDQDDFKLNAEVSPAARELAEELGIDLGSLRGSGSQGRILVTDVEQAGAETQNRGDADRLTR
ncbi:MAG: E3 binding domain-containing protein [Desulfuromonadales bacterium]|nr:E3 binding domain-containing protein [Desulfuromonadales bacterium]MBN2792773.1 E3 binding domain-containing protein [Desulfuromonadales bacterium]